ncbi:MAG TPA: GTP-binding protein [Clostridiaceae bacterium]|nr:GTP-binding protein [Clostridiaceae bacterium]
MTKLFLITGFLGSGKTTFLKNFVKLFPKDEIAIIINEFGKEGIDAKLLSSLKISISEIVNGSIFCVCRLEQFKQTLKEVIEKQPDIVIVETSGLSDPTGIRDILSSEEFRDIQYMGSICLVDALNLKKVYSTARVCKAQIATSDIAVINKTDIASADEIENCKEILKTQKPNIRIFETSFGYIKPEWIDDMTELKPDTDMDLLQADTDTNSLQYMKNVKTRDITLQKYLILVKDTFTYQRFIQFIKMFVEDTYRIKGFVSIGGEIYLVDCVSNMIKVEKHDIADSNNSNIVPGRIVVLSGKGMPTRKSIKDAVSLYHNDVISFMQN